VRAVVGIAGLTLFGACSARVARVGFLWSNPRTPGTDTQRVAFLEGLRDVGYVDGQNLHVEWRYPSTPSDDELAALANELVGLRIDVLVTVGTPPVIAAKQATRSVPIVMASIGDPVRSGIVHDLARPGGNVTGLSQLNPGQSGKRVDLIHQIAPSVDGIAYVHQAGNATNLANLVELQTAAAAIGITVQPVAVDTADDIEPGLEEAVARGARAVIVPGTGSIPQANVNATVIRLAQDTGLLSMGFVREFAVAGGLLGYGADILWSFRRAGYYVHRILKGANPADLPIEQPTAFQLVINRTTADTLGLALPAHVLLEATEIVA
jgi:putative ABC transport system substrate-binding protein